MPLSSNVVRSMKTEIAKKKIKGADFRKKADLIDAEVATAEKFLKENADPEALKEEGA